MGEAFREQPGISKGTGLVEEERNGLFVLRDIIVAKVQKSFQLKLFKLSTSDLPYNWGMIFEKNYLDSLF